MIRLIIEVPDHPSWAECTKEAVAELLDPLGKVRVVKVEVDKHRSASIGGPRRMEGSDGEKPKAATPPVSSRSRTEAAGRRPPNASVTSQQMAMAGAEPTKPRAIVPPGTCPKCGKRVISLPGPEGERVERDLRPSPFWPEEDGPVWCMDVEGQWRRGRTDGDLRTQHTVGFAAHDCTHDCTKEKEE